MEISKNNVARFEERKFFGGRLFHFLDQGRFLPKLLSIARQMGEPPEQALPATVPLVATESV